MLITDIQLTGFRNYTSQKIEPGRFGNIVVGPNAQGKSNLLEAIYLLATTKSHRTIGTRISSEKMRIWLAYAPV